MRSLADGARSLADDDVDDLVDCEVVFVVIGSTTRSRSCTHPEISKLDQRKLLQTRYKR